MNGVSIGSSALRGSWMIVGANPGTENRSGVPHGVI